MLWKMSDIKSIFSSIKKEDRELNSKILLVDGINDFIRNFSATPTMNEDGEHIGGVVGFLKSLGASIRLHKPTRVIIVFDGKGGSLRRKKLYPEYKEGRKVSVRLNRTYNFKSLDEEEDAIQKQMSILVECLQYLPVNMVAIDHVEADDVIAYIAQWAANALYSTTIVSTDKDYLQLINNNITVWNPIKKILYNCDEVVKEYNIHPSNFLMFRIMDGDKSDNIDGIKGAGPKTTLKAFPQLSAETKVTLDELFDYSLTQKSKLHEKVTEQTDILKRNYQLMNLQEPQMSSESKLHIVSLLRTNPPILDKFHLTRLFQSVKLWASFPHFDDWIFSTFNHLIKYSK